MNHRTERLARAISLGIFVVFGAGSAMAAPKTEPVKLTAEGEKLQARYAAMLSGLHAEITKALPTVSEQKKAALQKAREALKAAEADVNTAQKSQEKIKTAKALVDHAKGKWLGGAAKGIAAAEAALKKATTEAEREAAKKDLAKWQADREAGLKALEERQKALEKALLDQENVNVKIKAAQATLAQAQANELKAAESILADLQPILSSEKLDRQLIRAAVLAKATPRGLAEFAQQGKEQAALVDQLLADDNLMMQMLVAGGAEAGKYGPAMQIYTAIQKASPKARAGVFQRLALATSLEHAVPIKQSNAQTATDAPTIVDPVKRYLHYEKAYLDGELDPAFKNFSVWEYRMVVDCDAPDSILAWGREMLRNYRPDHIYNSDYGWRYSGTVRTEVKYGSECVKDDLPSLHAYQNIPKDGGVCGRRAFFGRFILKCFGIPTWGVTQHKHAAVGHWTPKGWVINLGAGFQHSWWDKDESPRSGSDFLLETQARSQPKDYMNVLRAQWVSRVLGEQEYNERKRVAGGLWSNMAHYQARSIATAAKAVALAPLGQELGEANESEAKKASAVEKVVITAADQKPVVGQDGTITIPSVAHNKPTGHFAVMKSFSGGLQKHASGGFKAQYVIDAPQAGKYLLAARVATVHEGQKFLFTANDTNPAAEVAVPYTVGMWQQSKPIEVVLVKGQNLLRVEIKDGSRGVAIKEFSLTPMK
jgi:hypothetical protein